MTFTPCTVFTMKEYANQCKSMIESNNYTNLSDKHIQDMKDMPFRKSVIRNALEKHQDGLVMNKCTTFTMEEYRMQCCSMLLNILDQQALSVENIQDNLYMPFRKNVIKCAIIYFLDLGLVKYKEGVYYLTSQEDNVKFPVYEDYNDFDGYYDYWHDEPLLVYEEVDEEKEESYCIPTPPPVKEKNKYPCPRPKRKIMEEKPILVHKNMFAELDEE